MSTIAVLCVWGGSALMLGELQAQPKAASAAPGNQAKQTDKKQAKTPPRNSKGGPVAKASEEEMIEDPLQERVENGVLVVRRSIRRANESEATEKASDTVLTPAAKPNHGGYRLYRVRNDEAWRYSRPRDRSQHDLQRSWEYRPQSRKYQPPPRRTPQDTERLWKYRKR